MDPADRIAITDLLSLHGHLVDAGESTDELFTPDIEYDVTDLGGGVIVGLAALQEAAEALGDQNPVGHHITNIVLTESGPNEVTARSKGLGVMADGTCGSVTYDDLIIRTPTGWRLRRRRVLARRRPLGR
ncbi:MULTISPECIES: nuclear transport factor 2 family protein [unclassified Kribbella]|uniref:nuclear transport factor 2 family protein n=1 Tax=unclassified Kribbella TaxID=2644121 RepID=UPI003017F7C3